MAVSDKDGPSAPSSGSSEVGAMIPASKPPSVVASQAPRTPATAPVWVVPLYVGGLVFVYLGERVLESLETGRWVVTALGVLAVLAATVLRFSPRFRAGGERQGIENRLAALSVLGIVGLGMYVLTTDWGMDRTGLTTADPETREHVLGILRVVWVSLIVISVMPMLFAEAALYPMRRAPLPESRRVRAAAASGLVLALAAVYGSLFVYAAGGVTATADYSYFKTSRPSESTRRIAESLNEPITVTAFFPDVNEAKSEVERYLRDLASGVPKLRIEVKDHLQVPKLARELHVTQDGAIVLAKGKITETLVIGTDMKNARPKLKTLDQDFQEKLLKLARSRRTAYLTVGHGELNEARAGQEETGRSTRILRTLLQKQNYLVKDLGLAQGLGNEVPDDAEVVLVLGPSEPFAREEIATLKRYGDRGGHVLLALDPDALSERDIETAELVGDEASAVAGRGDGEGHSPDASRARNPGGAVDARANKADGGVAHKREAAVKIGADAGPRRIADAGATLAAKAPDAAARAGDALAMELAPRKEASGIAATLDALAELAGLTRVEGVLANDKDHLVRRHNDSDRTLLITNAFSSHASVSTLSRNSTRAAVVAFGAGGLESKSGATDKVDFTVRSRPGTFADTNRNYSAEDDEKRAVYNLAAAVTAPKKANGAKPLPKDPKQPADKNKKPTPQEMRAFVIADADAFTDLVMANVIGNQVLFVDAVRWLGGEESFAGQQTTEEDVRIEHTKQKDLVWFYTTIFGAPALILGLGVLYSRRSRRTRPRGGKS